MSRQYEYRRFDGPHASLEIRIMWLNNLLKEQGDEGWILCTYTYEPDKQCVHVTVQRPVAIFMREKREG